MFDIRNPSKVLQYLEMDAKTSNHYSETLVYATQFNKTMWSTVPESNSKILAAAGAGQRNEIKFFESAGEKDEGSYKATHHIN